MILKSDILTLIETLYVCGLTDIRGPICQDNATHFLRVTKDHVYSFKIRKCSNLFVLYTTQISIELRRIPKEFYIIDYFRYMDVGLPKHVCPITTKYPYLGQRDKQIMCVN